MRLWLVVGLLCSAELLGACAHESDSQQERPRSSGDTATRDARAPSHGRERVWYGSARLVAGRKNFALISIPAVGRVLLSCDGDAGPSVAFKANHKLATADVVVDIAGGDPVGTTLEPDQRYDPAPPAATLSQTWQIAPFASANVHVTEISVVARRLDDPGMPWACAASARVSSSKSIGATRQG